jgi:hypothetical protein
VDQLVQLQVPCREPILIVAERFGGTFAVGGCLAEEGGRCVTIDEGERFSATAFVTAAAVRANVGTP